MMRRQYVALLFTDLCGSTELGRTLEFEEYRNLLVRLRALWHDAAQRHGGVVVRTQGDGAVLVFGHTEPGEMDGLRAAEAALWIHEAVAALDLGDAASPASGRPPLQAHSGVHAGLILIEDGDLERGRYDLVGDAANTAAKLQQAAGPGEILASQSALGPHSGLLHVQAIAPTDAQRMLGHPSGGGGGGLLWRVLGRTGRQRRFDSMAQRGLTPLVGRSDVLERLRRFLVGAESNRPACAVLTAEAGLGKTRLLEELGLALHGAKVLRGTCERTANAEALQPFVQMVRALASTPGARPDDGGPGPAEPAGGTEQIARTIAELARQSPLVLLIDDWQWADEASRLVLLKLTTLDLPLRVVVAARPHSDDSPWLAGALQVALRPLLQEESALAIKRLLPDADPFLCERIHRHSGGVPLFIEELCHGTTARDLAVSFGHARGAQADWVSALVSARLLQLPEPAVRLVRTAAIIGIEVPPDLLEAASGLPLDRDTLGIIAQADLMRMGATDGTLSFKHGITHEAVYGAIELSQRRQLHRRVLDVLRAERAPVAPATLAYHSWGAAEWRETVAHAEEAGDRAAQAFALDRARTHYRQAIEATSRLTQATLDERAHSCRLVHKLGMACVFDPLSIEDGTRAFERALATAQDLADRPLQARSLYWLAYIEYGMGSYRSAQQHAQQALALAHEVGDRPLVAQIEASMGQILHGSCRYDEAIALIDKALQAKRQRARPGSGVAVGSAYALACKGSMLADRGDFAQAWPCFEEAIELLGQSLHPVANSVRNWFAVSCIWAGRWDRAETIALESIAIAEPTRALLLLSIARSVLGYARWCRGDGEAATRLLHDSVAWISAHQGRMFTSLHFGWLAEVSAASGRIEQARTLTAHVLRRARQGERLGEGIAARAMARIEWAAGRRPRAQRWLARAQAAAAARGSHREAALNRVLAQEMAVPSGQ